MTTLKTGDNFILTHNDIVITYCGNENIIFESYTENGTPFEFGMPKHILQKFLEMIE